APRGQKREKKTTPRYVAEPFLSLHCIDKGFRGICATLSGGNPPRYETNHNITGNRPTIIIDNNSQPGLFGDAFVVFEDNIKQGMIGLPDGIGGLGLTTVEKLECLIVGFAALLCQHL